MVLPMGIQTPERYTGSDKACYALKYEIIHRHLNAVGSDIWLKVFHAYRFLRHTYIMTTRSSMIPTNDRMEERQLAWVHLFDSVPDPIKERFFPPLY